MMVGKADQERQQGDARRGGASVGAGGLSPPTPKTPLEAKKVLGFRDGGQGRSGFRDSGQGRSGEATSFGGDAHPPTPRIKIIQRGSSPPLLLVLPSTP